MPGFGIYVKGRHSHCGTDRWYLFAVLQSPHRPEGSNGGVELQTKMWQLSKKLKQWRMVLSPFLRILQASLSLVVVLLLALREESLQVSSSLWGKSALLNMTLQML